MLTRLGAHEYYANLESAAANSAHQQIYANRSTDGTFLEEINTNAAIDIIDHTF